MSEEAAAIDDQDRGGAPAANAISGDRERYLESGFDGYLSKPIAVAELKQQLHRGLGHRAAGRERAS